MMSKEKFILDPRFNLPRRTSEIRGKDGKIYLQFNTHMVTFYRQTYGELSRFFQALKDGRLIGAQCKKCGLVMVPPFTWHCPDCNFAEMEEIILPHRGKLAATAPITIFPSASFIGQAPFCRGYVDVAIWAKIASFLPSRLRTTTGLPRPGIFLKGINLKLVFKVHRNASILDIFWVPMDEIPKDLRHKEPLLASKLDFETPKPPVIEMEPSSRPVLESAIRAIREMAAKIAKSSRAQNDLLGREYTIGIRTSGGNFGIVIAASRIRVETRLPSKPDFTMVIRDPSVFIDWTKNRSLTDAVVEGILWLPNREAFTILPILDRVPRSIRRDV